MPRLSLLATAIGIGLAAGILQACSGSSPSRFYVLTPQVAAPSDAPMGNTAIGVGPVVIPQYLDRPEIVTRTSDNRLDLGEFDQWGGRLGDNVNRTLAENLSGLLHTDRVAIFPWTDATGLEHQVIVDITQFERDPTGNVVLTAFWSIVDAQSGQVLTNRRSTIQKPVAAASGTATAYDETVAAMSQALGSLSEEIATALGQL